MKWLWVLILGGCSGPIHMNAKDRAPAVVSESKETMKQPPYPGYIPWRYQCVRQQSSCPRRTRR